MLPKMKGSHFVKKYSVQFVNQRGKLSEPFYFIDHKPHESSQTWQVRRSEFDHLMLNNAREHGVNVHEGVRVLEVLFEGDKAVGVRHQDRGRQRAGSAGEGRRRRQRAELDAHRPARPARVGPGAEEGRRVDVLEGRLPRHRPRRGGHDGHPDRGQEGLVLVHPAARRHRQRRRRGRVTTTCSRTGPRKDLEAIYFEEVAKAPGVQPRIKNATRCDIFRAQKEYSYRAKQAAGDGWVLCGDAFGFLDPLYSSGVLLALTSGVDGGGRDRRGARRRATRRRSNCGKWEPGFVAGHGADAPAGVRVLRRVQLRPVRAEAPAPEGPRHRRADRRRVQGRRGRPVAADGRAAGRGRGGEDKAVAV